MNGAPGSIALLELVQWIEGLLHSELVTSIAVLAVAGVGFNLLSGRMAIRRAATVALGCFLVFGASAIARGLFGVAEHAAPQAPHDIEQQPFEPPMPDEDPLSGQTIVADPYAGATISG